MAFLFPATGLAKFNEDLEKKQIIRAYVAKDKFHWEICGDICEPLGNPDGYTREEIERWKKFRPQDWKDALPLMGATAGVAMAILLLVLAPAGVSIAAILALMGLVGYGTISHPQFKAGMNNDVYGEFESNPELLTELKRLLAEVDAGVAVTEKNPRVISLERKAKPAVPDNVGNLEPRKSESAQ